MWRIITLLCLLIIISVVSLSPCLNNDFVNWDDDKYITGNNDIRNLNWNTFRKIFSQFYSGAYVPLTILSFAFDYQIGGLNPSVYHRTNLILHLLNGVLVFWVIYFLCKRISISFLTALLFAIHPLHVEPVAWVTGRKDLLYGFFLIGSLVSYLYYKRKSKLLLYLLSMILCIMALLSKPTAVSFPLVILAFDYFLFNGSTKKSIIYIIPFLFFSIIFFVVAVIAQKSASAVGASGFTFFQHLNLFMSNFLFYLFKMLIPTKLACMYPIQNYWFAPFILLLLIIVFIISYRYTKVLVFSLVLYLILMLPVLQLIPAGQILADRYAYLSITGFLFIIANFIFYLYQQLNKIMKNLFQVIIIFVFIILGYLSYNQCRIWKNSYTLWTNVIDNFPSVVVAYNQRGIFLGENKDYQNAINDFTKALSINPKYVSAYTNRGNIYSNLGQYTLALEDYNQALSLNSTDINVLHNRAVLYFNMKEYELSLKDLIRIRNLGGDVPDNVINYIRSFINGDK
ncbi:MAG: tetratricopeptide repeat protein [candidate division WOR-3 bacterium]